MIVLTLIMIPIIYIIQLFFYNDDSIIFEIVFSTTYFSYYFFFELIYGATPGKFLTKTIVVDKKGDKPHWGYLIVRTLVRMVPIEVVSFLFGPVGLHDLISKTMVVTRSGKEVIQSSPNDLPPSQVASNLKDL